MKLKLIEILQDLIHQHHHKSSVDDAGTLEFDLVLPQTWYKLLMIEIHEMSTIWRFPPDQSPEWTTINLMGAKVTIRERGVVTYWTDDFFRAIYDKI